MDFGTGIKILIVDEQKDKAEAFIKLLKLIPISIAACRHVQDAAKAGKILREKKYDLAFLRAGGDSRASSNDLAAIRRRNTNTPVILLVSWRDSATALMLLEHGAQDYINDTTMDSFLLEKTIRTVLKTKHTEDELKHSNERYELVSKAANEMVWDWDLLNNKVFRSKDGWDKVFGKSENGESEMADSWWDRVHPDDREKSNKIIEDILGDESIEHFEIECRIMKNDGQYATVVDRGYVLRNDSGEVTRLIGATQNITDKKIAEEDLRRLSKIARETINAVAITNAEGRIQWINESFERLTGLHKKEIEGKEFADFFREAGTEEVAVRYIRRKINTHRAFEADIFIYAKSSKKVWLKLQCQPQSGIRDKSFFAIITDISRDKETEEILIASEKRFRNIIEKSSEGMALLNVDGIVMEMSRAGKQILGYSTEQGYAEGNQNFIYPEDAPFVDAVFAEVKSLPGQVKNAEYRFQKKNGEYIWLESAFHNLLHEPEIEAVVIHFRDISSRKYFEQVLKNSEENYRNLFNNNPSAIFIWDPADLSIIEMNEAAQKEYGYSKREFIKEGMRGIFAKQDHDRLQKLSYEIMSHENHKSDGMWLHLTKSGEERLMEVTFRGIDYYGKQASLAIVNNITEKIKLEEKLAEERRERQDEITSAVITAQEQEREELGRELHDNINQILATTKLYIEYALTNDHKRTELLISAKEFIESAVGEIRALSKSLVPPSLGEVGLKMALNELVKSVQPVSKFQIETNWDIKNESHLSEKLKLTIFRIIQEQLNNISKHANADKVWISVNEKKKLLVVDVKDNGEGFDLQQRSGGVGLKNILSRAHLHNGKLTINTEKGKGCTLSVSFKL